MSEQLDIEKWESPIKATPDNMRKAGCWALALKP